MNRTKPIIIKDSKIPKMLSFFIDIYAITLYPFIIIKDRGNEITINHEKIHLAQQRELFVLGFYVLYVYYWMIGKVKGLSNDAAYMNIPFEREAYTKQYDLKYLENRDKHAWKKYKNQK